MNCKTKGCRNKARPQRNYCNTCAKRKYRARYPIKYCYQTLRANAMRRGKLFLLTYEEFLSFCNETNYHDLRGRSPEALSVDRINPFLGYTKENIRAITFSENSSKGNASIGMRTEEPPF